MNRLKSRVAPAAVLALMLMGTDFTPPMAAQTSDRAQSSSPAGSSSAGTPSSQREANPGSDQAGRDGGASAAQSDQAAPRSVEPPASPAANENAPARSGESRGNGWGLWGLVGLFGLFGLAGNGRAEVVAEERDRDLRRVA